MFDLTQPESSSADAAVSRYWHRSGARLPRSFEICLPSRLRARTRAFISRAPASVCPGKFRIGPRASLIGPTEDVESAAGKNSVAIPDRNGRLSRDRLNFAEISWFWLRNKSGINVHFFRNAPLFGTLRIWGKKGSRPVRAIDTPLYNEFCS